MMCKLHDDDDDDDDDSILKTRPCIVASRVFQDFFCKKNPGNTLLGPLGVLEIWGDWLFIFRELRSTGNYFQGFGEQAHSLGDLGDLWSPAKK